VPAFVIFRNEECYGSVRLPVYMDAISSSDPSRLKCRVIQCNQRNQTA